MPRLRHTTRPVKPRDYFYVNRRPVMDTSWKEFRRRFFDEYVSRLADATQFKWDGIFRNIQDLVNPQSLSDMNSERLVRYCNCRRLQGVQDNTIGHDLDVIFTALGWAVEQQLLREVPHVSVPPSMREKRVKGRPITPAEFEKLLSVCDDPAIKLLIEGLYWSGLRINEAVHLSWEESPDYPSVVFSQEFPMLRIPAKMDKGRRNQLIPMAPEFARMLQDAPESTRTGWVFKLPIQKRDFAVSEIGRFGRLSGIVVNEETGKHVTAHDLRRSFGDRWAMRVMPVVLMQMMRHRSIQTTLKYYTSRNSQEVARAVWASMGMNPGQ